MSTPTIEHRWTLQGTLEPLAKGPGSLSRVLGGWLTTYGQIADDGSIVPTVDREGQVMEAASDISGIDWSGYMRKGLWNDRHDRTTIIGRPLSLEYHDASSPFAQLHRKVGFYGTGALFDANDSESFGDYKPSSRELSAADGYWQAAQEPCNVSFSVDGVCKMSPCRKRVTNAWVDQMALYKGPLAHNPDAVVEQVGSTPFEWLRKGMVGDGPCAKCVCAPGSCGLLRKGATPAVAGVDKALESRRAKALIQLIIQLYGLDEASAKEFLRRSLAAHMKEIADGSQQPAAR